MPFKCKVRDSNRVLDKIRRIKAEWFASQGNKCAQCPATERLECDHVDRAQKEIHTRHLWTMSAERRAKELAKCQALCHDCHLTKSMAEMQVHHANRQAFEREVYVGMRA